MVNTVRQGSYWTQRRGNATVGAEKGDPGGEVPTPTFRDGLGTWRLAVPVYWAVIVLPSGVSAGTLPSSLGSLARETQ